MWPTHARTHTQTHTHTHTHTYLSHRWKTGIIASKARRIDIFILDLNRQVGRGVERGPAVVHYHHSVVVRASLTLDAGVHEHLPALLVHPEELHTFLGRQVERQVLILTQVLVGSSDRPWLHVEDFLPCEFRLVDLSDVGLLSGVQVGEVRGVVVDVVDVDGYLLNGSPPDVRDGVVQGGHAERIGRFCFPV